MNIVYSLGVFLLTFVIHNAIGLFSETAPQLCGGPLIEGNLTSRAIYTAGGSLAAIVLFWNKIFPLLQTILKLLGIQIGGVGPTPTPVDGWMDILKFIQSLIGSDAKLAILKPVLEYFLAIPQFQKLIQGIADFGWPTYFYIVFAWPGKVCPVAGGTMPELPPMPTPPPTPVVVHQVVPPQVLPPAPANVVVNPGA